MSFLDSVKQGKKAVVTSIEHNLHSSMHPNDTPHLGHGPEKGEDWGGSGHRLESMGLRLGKTIQMLSNQGHGPVLIMVDGARLAIGRGIAKKIMVREPEGGDGK